MKKDFIRELHAELAPAPDEERGAVQTASTALTETERRDAEFVAESAGVPLSRFIRISVRRTLREAREAGVLAEKVTTPA